VRRDTPSRHDETPEIQTLSPFEGCKDDGVEFEDVVKGYGRECYYGYQDWEVSVNSTSDAIILFLGHGGGLALMNGDWRGGFECENMVLGISL
jgi:hypothetical protein